MEGESKLVDFFSRKFLYAIVGASNNEEKYGYKIFKTLIDAGYKAIPINPKEKEIYGKKVYSRLSLVKERIDVVDFVVPAGVTLKVLEEVKNLGIKKVWFQPNSFDDKVLSYARRNKIKFLKDFCLLQSVLKSSQNNE